MIAILLAAFVLLCAVVGVMKAGRAVRNAARVAGGDVATTLFALVAPALPRERREWGQAMLAELPHISGRRARWGFALGCAWVALVRPGPQDSSARILHGFVVTGIAASAGLAAYGLVRYPGLRADGSWSVWVLALTVVLLGYAAGSLAVSRGTTPQAVTSRRWGLAGGLAFFALVLIHDISPQAIVTAVAYVSPLAFSALAARSSGSRSTGIRAALCTALLAGLLFSVGLVTGTYLNNGDPYNPGTVLDYQRHGTGDLVTYAVADNLGGAIFMLAIVPVATTLAGCVGAMIGAVPVRSPRSP